MGGMLKGNVIMKIAWASEKLYNHSRFSTHVKTKEPTEELLDVMPLWELTLCQTAKIKR